MASVSSSPPNSPQQQQQPPQSPQSPTITTLASAATADTSSVNAILATPLNTDELEFEVNDPGFVRDFQKAWAQFLKDNPDMIPEWKRENKIRELQDEAREIEEEKLKVLKEMEQQIEFFKASCEALEDVYAGKMQTAIEKQRRVQDDLQNRLDDVAIADHLQQQTLPWHHFMHEVEQAAKDGGESLWNDNDNSLDGSNNNSILSSRISARPSAHARVLTDRKKGSASDVLLRSYRIDHALLSTHIRILSKEVERYERVVRAQEMTGKFLRDHNAWSILNKDGSSPSLVSAAGAASGASPSSSSVGGTTAVSGVTSITDSHIL